MNVALQSGLKLREEKNSRVDKSCERFTKNETCFDKECDKVFNTSCLFRMIHTEAIEGIYE